LILNYLLNFCGTLQLIFVQLIVVEYLLGNTKLKETLTKEVAQKILLRIGKKYNVSAILQKEVPIVYNAALHTLNEESRYLEETIRLLHRN